ALGLALRKPCHEERAAHHHDRRAGDGEGTRRREAPRLGQIEAQIVGVGRIGLRVLLARVTRAHMASSSGSCVLGGVRRRMLYMTGTKKRVVSVASTRPPMTARPRGAFCSPPSPI